jgi:hypothetical protein
MGTGDKEHVLPSTSKSPGIKWAATDEEFVARLRQDSMQACDQFQEIEK